MPSATYDTASNLVILDQIAPSAGAITLDVQRDLYSDAKQQWLGDLSLNRFEFPWQAIGGQPLPGGAVAPRIYFLLDPWQIRPYEADHDLNISRNLFSENGIPLFVPTLGEFTVNSSVTNDFSSGDDRVQDILDYVSLLIDYAEADEELAPTTARKYHRVTKALILDKTVTGGSLSGTITIDE